MELNRTPKANRLHIGLFGRRNAGKSSVLNALTRQEVSIVSQLPGTTTDPVEKPMELLPIGPVLFIDTAGVDDTGALGEMRVAKTRAVLDRTDLAILVCAQGEWDQFEEMLLSELNQRQVPVIVVFNKSDLGKPTKELKIRLTAADTPFVETVASTREGILDLRAALIQTAPADLLNSDEIIGDLIPKGELVILVVPIDKEAPKGRIILPQVQTIRDVLDHNCYCLVVKESELAEALARLNRPPALVVTDSQAFAKVSADTPKGIKLTSFSILFARHKGDLIEFVRGALAIDKLKPGDSVLICESCTHHPIGDDIGRVKIPKWLQKYIGGELRFVHYQGHDFPNDISGMSLVIQCGGCMHNRREILSRIARCNRAGIPITNYGLTIAYTLGILARALEPFPAALSLYEQSKK